MDNTLNEMVFKLYYEGYFIWEIAMRLNITEAHVVRILETGR